MFEQFSEKLENLEKKVDENQKMLWMVTFSAAAVILMIQILPSIGLQLTPAVKASNMVAETAFVNGSD